MSVPEEPFKEISSNRCRSASECDSDPVSGTVSSARIRGRESSYSQASGPGTPNVYRSLFDGMSLYTSAESFTCSSSQI